MASLISADSVVEGGHLFTAVFPFYLEVPTAGVYRCYRLYIDDGCYLFINGSSDPVTIDQGANLTQDPNSGLYYAPVSLNAGINRVVLVYVNSAWSTASLGLNFISDSLGGSPLQYYRPPDNEFFSSLYDKHVYECLPVRTSVEGLPTGIMGAFFYVDNGPYLPTGDSLTYSCFPRLTIGNKALDDINYNPFPLPYNRPDPPSSPNCVDSGWDVNFLGKITATKIPSFSYVFNAGWFNFWTDHRYFSPSHNDSEQPPVGSQPWSLFLTPQAEAPLVGNNQELLGHTGVPFSGNLLPRPEDIEGASDLVVTVGGLPDWATLDRDNWSIQGTPSAPGKWDLRIETSVSNGSPIVPVYQLEEFYNFPKDSPADYIYREWYGVEGMWHGEHVRPSSDANYPDAVELQWSQRPNYSDRVSYINTPVFSKGVGDLKLTVRKPPYWSSYSSYNVSFDVEASVDTRKMLGDNSRFFSIHPTIETSDFNSTRWVTLTIPVRIFMPAQFRIRNNPDSLYTFEVLDVRFAPQVDFVERFFSVPVWGEEVSDRNEYQTKKWEGAGGEWVATRATSYGRSSSSYPSLEDSWVKFGLKNANQTSEITSPVIAGGMGRLKFRYRAFEHDANTGEWPSVFRVFVNGIQQGPAVTAGLFFSEFSIDVGIRGEPVQLVISAGDGGPSGPIEIQDVEWERPDASLNPQYSTIAVSGDVLFGTASYSDPSVQVLKNLTSAELNPDSGDIRKVLFSLSEDLFTRLYQTSQSQENGFKQMAATKTLDTQSDGDYLEYMFKFNASEINLFNQIFLKPEN